ncbi:MAG: helicase-exonuclease AddAB subunit AddA [Clostridiales Family XIII bacterium]|jgi:ATP-dependent helicase/nuclease subunit A|nr:helicase-exonuclease AddAB subunit AddA [Clostridiales Family XIII bacterium]
MTWTKKQQQTIETRGKNVLVSAAAGSGKTAVLTERILKLVTEDKAPLKELLVVTFTEAAASEMKHRIAAALAEAAETDDFAQEQLRQIGAAKIMTFHAFCLTVLKKHYYAIDLDPSFSIADEKRATALKEQALDEMLAEAFADGDAAFREAFLDFLLNYSQAKDERSVREKILKVYEFVMTDPEPWGWLGKSVDALFAPPEDLVKMPAMAEAFGEIKHKLELARALTERTGALLASYGLERLAAKNAIDLERAANVERLFLAGDMDGTRKALADISFEQFRAAAAEKEDYDSIKELVAMRRDRVKTILRDELRTTFFSQALGEYADEIGRVAPYARTLETLVKRFAEAYERVKRGENAIDFADFEHMALRILESGEIADDYRRKLSYIFVDEYQDSNYVQEALIGRVSREDNVFMVGDVKQSIYSFRNAAPEIFLEKQRRYPSEEAEEAEEAGGTREIRIDLSTNFRSKRGVIDAVNALFEVLIEQHISGMGYDADARLVPGVEYGPAMEGRACLHLIQKDKGKEVFGSDTEGEAALCAEIIADTVGRPFYDTKLGLARPIAFRDIAILLRAAKGAAEVYRKALEARGIPAFTDRGEGYFETVEIDTFLGLLRAVVNPRRDVPLAASMCSAVFGFELAELAEIRAEKTDGYFYAAFLAYAQAGADTALREKCAAMAERLAKWRDEERFMRLDDFLWKLLRASGFYDYAGALPRGELRQANLRALLDRAADYQKGRVEGLRGFLAYLDKIRLRGEVAQVNLLTDGEDVCRIMTIHGSKGLEFPVVILGGLGKPLAKGGLGDDSLLLRHETGLSLYLEDHRAHTFKKTLLHSALKLKNDVDERAECIRLLYVAMTRAMDTLHMIGTLGDPEKQIRLYGGDGASPAVDTDILGASNYLQLILPTAIERKDIFELDLVAADGARGGARDSALPGRPPAAAERPETAASEKTPASDAPDGQVQTAPAPVPFAYPYAASTTLKSKYSVTELGRLGTETAPVFFMRGSRGEAEEDAGLSAAEKGTALHKALELLDFKEARAHCGERGFFEEYLSGLARSGALSEMEAASVGAEALLRFAGSAFCARAAASGFLMKEAPFNMRLPYGEAAAGPISADAAREEIVVQGVIDCLFEEPGGLVIADYKSGHFDVSAPAAEAERVRKVYGGQLGLYRRAAALIFGKPVKESFVYMTRAGVCVDIP